uniref:Prolactin regulatory element-binding protein n=1 Tax=Strigamia maritima TaxID=126957 RepID=T1JHF1_STRMM
MAPLGPSYGELLAKVNFPPYTVKMLTDRHVLIAGGGGKSKTGISNAIEIYELVFDGKTCRAEPCNRYETGERVIMNCTTFRNGKNYFLAAGVDESCQLYQIKAKFDEMDGGTDDSGLRHRRGEKREKKGENGDERLCFDIRPTECVRTDFSEDDGFQKVVRITPCRKFMITGGADGHIRFWKLPLMVEEGCIDAHKNEIDDLDVTLTQVYGTVEGDKKRICLYTSHIPILKQSKPSSESYLVKWDAKTYKPLKQQVVGTDVPSSMAISDDGRFLALGTMSGNVDVYITFSLQKLIHAPGVHNIFVTGLEFVPCSQDGGPLVTGDRDASLISISVDNQIRILHVPKQCMEFLIISKKNFF